MNGRLKKKSSSLSRVLSKVKYSITHCRLLLYVTSRGEPPNKPLTVLNNARLQAPVICIEMDSWKAKPSLSTFVNGVYRAVAALRDLSTRYFVMASNLSERVTMSSLHSLGPLRFSTNGEHRRALVIPIFRFAKVRYSFTSRNCSQSAKAPLGFPEQRSTWSEFLESHFSSTGAN